jgi:fatty acid desaturase
MDVGLPEPARAAGDESLSSLLHEVREAGLLRPRHGYYVVKVATNLVMLGAVWAAFVVLGDSWWQLVVAALLAFCYTQTGFIGHDIGHRQMAHDRRAPSARVVFSPPPDRGNRLAGSQLQGHP